MTLQADPERTVRILQQRMGDLVVANARLQAILEQLHEELMQARQEMHDLSASYNAARPA